MKDRVKRVQSFGLALMMALASFPLSAPVAWAAVTPTMNFVNPENIENGDPTRATVITGKSIDVREVLPVGLSYTPSRLLFQSSKEGGMAIFEVDTKDTGSGSATAANNTVIVRRPNNGVRAIEFTEKFNPNDANKGDGKQDQNATVTYYIESEYQAAMSTGSMVESASSGRSTVSVLAEPVTGAKSSTVTVAGNSSITLECTKTETLSNAPEFKITKTSGTFDRYKTVSGTGTGATTTYGTATATNTEPTKGENVSPNATRNLIVTIAGTDGSNELHLLLHPAATNPHYAVVDGVVDKTKIERYDNFILEKETFTISFVVESSNPAIALTVMTPQAVMEDIAGEIPKSDGEKNTDYIRLGTGDGLNWITQNFQILRQLDRYAGKFTIDWEWVAVDDDPDAKEFKQDAVKIGKVENNWSGVQIEPQLEDVEGYLIPKITYVDGNNKKLSMNTDSPTLLGVPKKRLLIRGRGVLPSTEQISEVYGEPPTTDSGAASATRTYTFKDGERGEIKTEKKMDAFRGGIEGYNPVLNGPYEYNLRLFMGESNGAADYATVTIEGDTSTVILQTSQGSETFQEYNSGDQIKNGSIDIPGTQGQANLKVLIQRPPENSGEQIVDMTIRYFIKGRNGTPQENRESTKRIRLRIQDSTPSQESRLKNLELRIQTLDGKEEVIEYGFSPDKKRYTGNDIIYIPYRAKSITLTPTYMDPVANSIPTTILIQDPNGKPIKNCVDDKGPIIVKKSGDVSEKVEFEESELGEVNVFTVVSPCLDPRPDYWSTYTLYIVRDRPSKDSTLASLGIFYPEDGNMTNNLVKLNPAVDQNGKPIETLYDLEIPYSTEMLHVLATPNHKWAEMEITPQLEGRTVYDRSAEWLLNLKEKFRNLPAKPESGDPADTGALLLKITVRSEDAVTSGNTTALNSTEYIVRIRRQPPSHNAALSGLKVTDVDDNDRTYRPTFNSSQETYTVDIPYSVKQIKFNITPADPNVGNIQVFQFRAGENLLLDMANGVDMNLPGQNKPLTFRTSAPTPKLDVLDVTQDTVKNMGGYHPFFIRVTPECEEDGQGNSLNHTRTYEVRVQRAEPSKDNLLKNLTIQDQDGVQIKTLAFHPDETEYTLQVPFETRRVSLTPTANHEYATIKVRDGSVLGSLFPTDVESGATTKLFDLEDPEKPKRFEVEVSPEDPNGEHKIYYVTITRDPPSNDARLKSLKADNTSEFKPLFIASKTEYNATLAEGAEGTIITAVANHPGATIKINGMVVPSGTPSDLIELIEIKQTVKVEVTAQDGVTKKVYNIHFTNENLIEKTNNADLRRLSVEEGLMTPTFKSSVTEYEVATTEHTWSVDIIPRVSDPLATMRVLNGTRELGDYNGNYSLALVDGQNDVTIEVTSPDKTVVKNYEVAIYRNEEDKLKNLTPLEAEDINYELSGNPIIVKIDEYPRVGASVFNTLREEYPEKTIVFQGNDYSVRFDAKNLTRVIPQTEIFDFRMSFSSPDEDDIYDLIEEWGVNTDILGDIVLMYFTYHGSLPGPAALQVGLGRKYANETLYWHYYNQERDRIDYYGALQSNSKGTIAVSIDHFSTYIVSPTHRIAGSEDKDGIVDELGMVSNGKDLLGNGGKMNPDTGVAEDRP